MGPRARGGSRVTEHLLRADGLVKHFPVLEGIVFRRAVAHVHAVDGVSFAIAPRETFGIVGESGCGKTTIARLVTRLVEADRGTITFEGDDITHVRGERLRRLRLQMQIIFQDPFASLNPRMTVGDIVAEPLRIHGMWKDGGPSRVRKLLDLVGLAAGHTERYPHEFSGGQRQRIGIARALALHPKLVVCDEPVSALDVSMRAQILNLLKDLQEEFGLTYLFISHDLSVVRQVCDRVAVMYLGQVVEIAERDALFDRALHPYTQALISAIPIPNPELERKRKRIVLQGDVPSPQEPPVACRFHTRCFKAQEICERVEPELVRRCDDHPAACHLAEPRAPMVGSTA
jgi:oligopeptide/dipeptide ABC transporter ATP-binding protein